MGTITNGEHENGGVMEFGLFLNGYVPGPAAQSFLPARATP